MANAFLADEGEQCYSVSFVEISYIHTYIHTYISVCFSAGSPRGSQAPEGRAGEKGVRGAPMEDVPRQGEAGGYEVRVVLNFILSFTKLLSLYTTSPEGITLLLLVILLLVVVVVVKISFTIVLCILVRAEVSIEVLF
jgi:hypothetical protein